MANDKEIPLFPVAGWTVGPIDAYNAVTIRFDFLTNALQAPDQANQGRHYVLLPAQAAELVLQIQKALRHLETVGLQAPPGERH